MILITVTNSKYANARQGLQDQAADEPGRATQRETPPRQSDLINLICLACSEYAQSCVYARSAYVQSGQRMIAGGGASLRGPHRTTSTGCALASRPRLVPDSNDYAHNFTKPPAPELESV